MTKIAIVIPCVITGLLLGAMTPTYAAPVPPNNSYQPQVVKRSNTIGVLKFDSTQEVFGCLPGLDLVECIDPPSNFDDDTTFKLLVGAGSLSCGTTPMTIGSTCQYSQAVFGDTCEARCSSVTIAADQTYTGGVTN